jgi:23S rRNA (uracil1939-C5)-methyltransferase
VQRVIGVESNPGAVAAARQNSIDNNIANVDFLGGDAQQKLQELVAEGLRPDVIIVDPPRKGLEKSLIEMIGKSAALRVVYISCNPKTLVRDLEIFDQHGFKTKDIYPFDMFPQTYHVESLTVLNHQSVTY